MTPDERILALAELDQLNAHTDDWTGDQWATVGQVLKLLILAHKGTDYDPIPVPQHIAAISQAAVIRVIGQILEENP